MGIGAALIMPGTLSTITSVFPPEERAKAVGIWAGFAGTGGTLGILVSGALLEAVLRGARSSSSPPCSPSLALVGVVARRAVHQVRASTSVSIPLGSVLSAVGIGLLVLGIIEGPEQGWTSPLTLGRRSSAASRCSSRSCSSSCAPTHPLLDPRLFRHRGFATGSASLFLQFFAMFGFFFVSLQFLQLVLGYSTFTAAVALLPMAALMLPLSAVSRARCRSGTATSSSAAPAWRCRRSGFALFAMLGTGSGYWPFLVATLDHRRRRRARDDAGDQRDRRRRSPAPSRAWRRRSTTPPASSAPRSASRCSAARSTPATATTSTPTSRACPADVADQAREAPAIAVQLAGRLADGAALDRRRAARRSPIGMRYALLLGVGLLLSARCSCGSAAPPAPRSMSRTTSTRRRSPPPA